MVLKCFSPELVLKHPESGWERKDALLVSLCKSDYACDFDLECC